MSVPRPVPHIAIQGLGRLSALDDPARSLAKGIRTKLKPGPVKDAMSGTWLGHALHPLLTDVPIGTWTSAVMLDWLGGRKARPAARRLVGIGLLAAGPTAATGWSEWADAEPASDEVRRVGIIHAASNIAGTALFGASWLARRNGGGRLLGLAGLTSLGVGGWLGGHMSYALGVGVDQTAFDVAPTEWTPSGLRDEDVAEGAMRRAEIGGIGVLVARHGGALHALADRCAHRGGPLHQGELRDGTVVCPWHSSTFRLEDGSICQGPSAYPQPLYDVRSVDGALELRAAAR